jgi:tRNA pseudouridine synthase 10
MIKIPESGLKVRTVRRKGQKVIEGASGEKIAKSVGKLTYKHFVDAQMCPPPVVKTHSYISNLTLWHDSIFLAGRYNKFQRHISNSPWIIDGQRLAEHSVEELIVECILPLFKCDPKCYRFSSAGREDADVLMVFIDC